jgi:long-chain acyl-CoA synthetase
MNAKLSRRFVLLTGATGFLGAQIARRLVREKDLTVIALVRAENQEAAARRLGRSWADWPELASCRVEVFAGDVSLPRLGLDEESYLRLAKRITHIIHNAAYLRLDASLDELRKINLQGTINMLELARLAQRDHGLERYAQVSTAYVAGARDGAIAEVDLKGEYGFNTTYELSKYEAESLVEQARSELPISVFRPGLIVGDSQTGEIRTFNTFYFPLRLYMTGRLHIFPGNSSLRVNIVPVDYVADAVARLTFCPEAEGLNFHLTAPYETLPKAGELLEFVRRWAREHLGERLHRPVYLRFPPIQKCFWPEGSAANRAGGHPQARRKPIWLELDGMRTLLPYFNERKQFQRDNIERLLGPYALDWREYLPRLLAYAADQGFMHRTERTVHEQLLYRLRSKTRPINYFDIVEGKMIARSAAEVRDEILAAAGSLTALGIQPGDRVAIVGLNSTRYLSLDTAIGLIGAVSVPLYYTSPPAEIDHILSASGARLLLIGAPKILERLDELQTKLPIISFWREALPAEQEGIVTSWEAFLALGAGVSVPRQAPMGFDDAATLRYSSGTTGLPKGVCFQHRQLRWSGQTTASLLPWKARNQTVDYLSFLPMNHVVEGILATYCTYYVPAPVNVYFLENLKELQNVMPKVRPTIFFSVPRIYERIWAALQSNPIGQRYLSLPNSLFKTVLGALLRSQTLKKAGLQRCAQLITGSAPCGEALLQNFRGLGIEIHNAYGMTEAPLISMNRLGANRLGTVGEPLPQTEIRIAEDGEVLVRGPQVMAGYFEQQAAGEKIQSLLDGWMPTGDLGYISPEGSLVLNGRKKELFKTSYGKYVQPVKVESLLREIPGVAEVMVVGEERPYLTALLWIQDKALLANETQLIDRSIDAVNHRLSHPEQVKRWAVLVNDLSIEAGDLTANLKLKRQAITRRMGDVLESLYNGMSPTQAVLYIGQAVKG